VRVRPEARGALAAFLAFGAFWGGWAVLVPSVQTAVGASKGQLGLALLGIGLGSIPAMTLVRRFVDRGLHLILPVSFVALAGAALLPAIVGSVAMLGAVLFVLGAFSGVLDVAINADIAAIEAETGTRLMQLAHAFFSIGVIVGAAIAGIMRQVGAGRLPV
jgi:predicted MFS family arabinose efflux permease